LLQIMIGEPAEEFLLEGKNMSTDDSDAVEFYRGMAGSYDEMTRFAQRLPGERALLEQWRSRYSIASALDAACGTGLHAIALAQLGVGVTGADLSPEMLAQARAHAAAEKVSVVWIEAAMEELDQRVAGSFDALFCLGNSLPHLLDAEALAAALGGFRRLLMPGGHLILQLINYEQVLAWQRRVVALTREGEREFIRFYDFGEPLLRFNILQIDWSQKTPLHTLQSVPLYPWRCEELESALKAAGYGGIEIYGDMQWGDYIAAKSQNLVIVAKG
jgi:glycine/sarcosine N-methyltransferase